MARSTARPYRWWLAVLAGTVPHGACSAISLAPDRLLRLFQRLRGGAEALLSYALYGQAELIIVPVSLLVVVATAAGWRTRPWAIWLLLGCLGGATTVLMVLATLGARVHLSFELGAVWL